MRELPVILCLEGRPCVVVGGGAVGARRAQALAEAGARVRVVDPSPCEALEALSLAGKLELTRRPVEASDLDGAFLVVVATNDPRVNLAVAELAAARGALLNRADDATQGDLRFMARARRGPITLAVSVRPAAPAVSRDLVRELAGRVDQAWLDRAALAARRRRSVPGDR